MSVTISVTEAQIFTALGNVLQSFGLVNAAGTAIPIVQGQANRVPAPAVADYAVMWPVGRDRLSTNVSTYSDNQITGSITANVLTVTVVKVGAVVPGQTLYGPNVSSAPVILTQTAGPTGGAGTYTVSTTANAASGPIYCGAKGMLEPVMITTQVDIHGPSSADNATRLMTQWRSETGTQACEDQGGIISPLYADTARQVPFINDQDQYEERWSVDLYMQANPIITVTQQFATSAQVTVKSVQSLAP